MTIKRRRVLWAAGGVVVAATAGGALFVAASRVAERRNDLLARAVPLVAPGVWRGTAPGSAPPSGGKYAPNFYWLNDHEVLRFAKNGVGVAATTTPVILDVSTGKARPVPGAPRLTINQSPLSVSPNGAWLLCVNRNVTPSRLFALALDGTGRRHTWKDAYANSSIRWTRDSKHFLSISYDWFRKTPGVRVYGMTATHSVKAAWSLPVAPPTGAASLRRAVPFVPAGELASGRFIGYVETNQGTIGSAAPSAKTTTASFTEFGLDAEDAPPRAITLPAPLTKISPTSGIRAALGASSHLFSSRRAQLSPQGDRLLWVVNTFEFSAGYGLGSRTSAFSRVLPYVYHALPRRMRPRASLRDSFDVFTSGVDGRGGLTHIGSISPTETSAGSIGSDFRWTPDGKRITFTRGNALYAIPADGM